jgi:hypothetical protein
MKRTLTSRISDIEQENLTLNAEERITYLEKMMKAIVDGKMILVPSMRYEALEKHLKIDYKLNPSGKYENTHKANKRPH